MRQSHRLASLVLIAGSLACRRGAAPAPATDPEAPLPNPLPKVAARVNGREIASLRVAHLARPALEGDGPAAQARAMRTTLAQCVDRELLLEEALTRGVAVHPSLVDRAFDQVRGRHKTEQEWSDALASDGLDPRSLRTEIHERFVVEALIAGLRAGLPPPTEAEIREYSAAHPDTENAEQGGGDGAALERAALRLTANRRDEVVARLVASLRKRARIEVFF